MNIVTTFVNPPIPDRSHDWCAFVEGEEEAGNYGYGATEAEAIQDLKDNLEEDLMIWEEEKRRMFVK